MTFRHAHPRGAFAALLVATSALLAGCPDDPSASDDLSWVDDGTNENASVVKLDAGAKDGWTYVSFEKGAVVDAPERPEESLDWDIAFQRYNVKTNGGTSGSGQGAAADLGNKDLKTTNIAAVGAWVEDKDVSDARTGDRQSMSSVLSGWYEYHFFKHQLVSKYRLYAVRGADGRVALFKIHDYYDDAGTAAKYTIVFRFPVKETDGETPDDGDGGWVPGDVLEDDVFEADGVVYGETNLDARSGRTFFSFAEGGAVTVDGDPKSSNAWDIEFDTWLLRTNGGTSGSAQGAALKSGAAFDDATEAPADGWVVDAPDIIGTEQREESTNTQLSDWFEYDPTTQRIASKGHVVWIRTADGRYGKFEVLGYYHPPTGEEAFYRLRWAFRPDGGRSFPVPPAR